MLLWITHSIYAIFSLIIQKYFIEISFSVTSRTLIKHHPPPYFTITENHEKFVDPPAPRTWRNYWIVPNPLTFARVLNMAVSLFCWRGNFSVFFLKKYSWSWICVKRMSELFCTSNLTTMPISFVRYHEL